MSSAAAASERSEASLRVISRLKLKEIAWEELAAAAGMPRLCQDDLNWAFEIDAEDVEMWRFALVELGIIWIRWFAGSCSQFLQWK